MFSLNGAVKYKYIPNYQDMRGGYDKLCGVIQRKMSECISQTCKNNFLNS